MINRYLLELRTKSHHHKRRFALVTSAAVTGAIFVAWLSVLLPSDTHRIVAENKPAPSAEVSPENTPFNTLKRQTADAYTAMKGLFESQISNVDLQNEYDSMKTQVESGQIKLAPASPVN